MDLARLKSLLGGSPQLLDQLSSTLGKSVLATTVQPATPASQEALPVSATLALTSALGSLVSTSSPVTAPPQFRAVVREDVLSGISTQALLTGAPQEFVASAAIDHTLGPIQSVFGPPIIIEFQPIMQAVSLFTVSGLTPLMLMTVEAFRFILGPQTSFPLPAGSVWILSQLLIPAAPNNEYIGLTIASGTITFSVPPTLTTGKLTMADNTTVQVELVLQQPTPASNPASQFGADARALALQLPATFNFHFSTFGAFTGSPGIDTVGPVSANVYGQALNAAFDPATAPVYDAPTRTVLILLTPDAGSLTIAQNLSSWITFEGAAPITLCAWALGSTSIDVAHPTTAAGIGSLLLRTGLGLAARWTGLVDAPLTLAETQIFLSPEALTLFDLTGTAHVGAQAFQLWQDAQNPHPSTVSLAFGPHARFESLSFSSGTEAIGVSCSADIEADRPIRVSGEPFPLRADISVDPATLILSGSDESGILTRRVLLVAPALLPPPAFPTSPVLLAAPPAPTFAIALRNALLKVTPAQSARIFGTWNQDAAAVDDGDLIVTFRTLSYVPTLPDPYVASLTGLRGPNDPGGFGHGAIPSALGTPWEILRCTVAWIPQAPNDPHPAPNSVTTSFALAADPANANQFGAAGPVQNEPFPDPDADSQVLTQLPTVTSIDYGGIWDDRSPRADNCALLDVSTNADLLGISFRLIRGELMIMLPTLGIETAPASLQVQGLDVVSEAAAVHAFLLPQVSWEPLLNLAPFNIDGDPDQPILFYPGDGGPSRLLNSNADTVPLSPLPLANFLAQQSQSATFEGAALFTLPWALQALARLRTRYTDSFDGSTRRGSQLQLPQQTFNNGLQTALRFELTGGASTAAAFGVSDSFMGATVQRNNVLSNSGNPTFASTLGGTVTKIFNQQFFLDKPGLDLDTGVPLTRIDLSGYGASSFSNWLDPAAVIASTSQAQFELMLGRCAHELVQVESILYPWGIQVVRTITLLRVASGYTYRNDSGWRAQGDGRFLFNYFIKNPAPPPPPGSPPLPPTVRTAAYNIHPGVVRALHSIRNIQETKAVAPFISSMFIAPGAPFINPDGDEVPAPAAGTTLTVELQPVFFDADVEIDGLVSGGHDEGAGLFVTPSTGILGFVQVQPFGTPLDADLLAALVGRQGSIGGPLNCVLQAGGSQHRHRISSFDFNNALADDNSPIFSVAARGPALLPKEGSWAVVRHEAATGSVRPLVPTAPLPLIRAGRLVADAVTHAIHLENDPATELTRIADPLEVVRQPAANTLNYGLLLSTDTQKALFLTPSFAASLPDLLSKTPPLFADAFRIANSKAIFPNIGDAVTGFGDAISLLANGTEFSGPAGVVDAGKTVSSLLATAADQSYNLLKKVPTFSLPDKEWDLLEFGGAFKLYIEYQTSKDAVITPGSLDFDIASDAAAVGDKWKSVMDGVAIVVDLGPMNRLITIKGKWDAQNGSEAQYGGIDAPTPEMVFSEDLRPVINLLQILEELQGEDYASALKDGLHLAMGNKADSWEYKLAADKEIPLVHFPPGDVPSPPLILDASLKVGLYLNESIQITTDTKQLLPSAGAFLNFFGRLSVNCFSVGAAAIYAVGQVSLDIAADTAKGPSLDMQFGFGAQVVVAIPVVGNVSVLFVIGVEIYLDKTTLSVSASLLYQGQASLLEGLIGITITIEAKGTITRTPLIGPGGQTSLTVQVTFALDISLFLVIDISFSKSWQEERQLA